MGFEGKPKSVKEAVRDEDTARLSAMGKKGAEITNKKRANKKEIEEIQQARMQELQNQEEQKRLEDANEHIIDADGNDLGYTPE